MRFRLIAGPMVASLLMMSSVAAATRAPTPPYASADTVQRTEASLHEENELSGTPLYIGVGVVALIAVLLGLLAILDNDSNAVPASP